VSNPVAWMKAGDFARHLDVSRSTLRRWTNAGMPSVKVGRVRRYYVAEAEQWLRDNADRDPVREKAA
jgi:excisionase family DNA binding protein